MLRGESGGKGAALGANAVLRVAAAADALLLTVAAEGTVLQFLVVT